MWIILAGVIFALVAAFSLLQKKGTNATTNTIKKGTDPIPLVKEVALSEFDTNTLNVLERCKKEYGDVFRIDFGESNMVYVLDANLLNMIQNNQTFDFAGISIQSKKRFHFDKLIQTPEHVLWMSRCFKGSMAGNHLKNQVIELGKLVPYHMHKFIGNEKVCSLMQLSRQCIFIPANKSIFGRNLDSESIIKIYELYDSDVPKRHGASDPKKTNSVHEEAWKQLADVFGELLPSHNNESKEDHSIPITLNETLFNEEIPHEEQSAALVFMMWAANANIGYSAFWLVNELLKNPESSKELESVIKSPHNNELGTDAFWSENDINSFDKLLESAVLESIRKNSTPSSYRLIKDDVDLHCTSGKVHHLEKGQWIAMQTKFLHHDEEIFPNPSTWNIHRFLPDKNGNPARFYKAGKIIKTPVNAFGGGVGACPGKSFAIWILKIFLATILHYYNIEQVGNDQPESKKYIVASTPPPTCDMTVKLTKK